MACLQKSRAKATEALGKRQKRTAEQLQSKEKLTLFAGGRGEATFQMFKQLQGCRSSCPCPGYRLYALTMASRKLRLMEALQALQNMVG
mmetsp:Transcript_69690/g.166371  ORF Transcript_69690/g.166371 Transcript_69690/m.166371 type:complete len:89 (-) Transcript_69690:910-1176(-)